MDGIPCKKCLASFFKESVAIGQLETQNIPKETHFSKRLRCVVKTPTLQGTNISSKNGILKMIFLFPRWDMSIPWRVRFVDLLKLIETSILHYSKGFHDFLHVTHLSSFSICIAPTSQRLPTTLYPAKPGISHIWRCCHATFLVVHAFPLKLSTTVAKIKTWKSKKLLGNHCFTFSFSPSHMVKFKWWRTKLKDDISGASLCFRPYTSQNLGSGIAGCQFLTFAQDHLVASMQDPMRTYFRKKNTSTNTWAQSRIQTVSVWNIGETANMVYFWRITPPPPLVVYGIGMVKPFNVMRFDLICESERLW